MGNIKFETLFNKVKKFLLNDIWKIELNKLPRIKLIAIKGIRIMALAYRGFNEDKVNLRASALTFYSVLSVVPVMAMALGVAKGFGFDEKLALLLQENMKGQEEVAVFLINFSNNMLNSVQGGWIFGIGLVFLMWTVLQVLGNIEHAFNSIWQVKRSRVFFRKFSDYFSIMLLAPILILLSSSSQVVIIDMVDRITSEGTLISSISPIMYSFVQFVPFVIIWLLFTIIYMAMPNTKVNFGSALVAGIIAGTAFQFLQWGYIYFQIGVSKYNAIYGSFAALPLFLVWLNWSWLIVLFGAEISFSAQNQHQYEYENDIKDLNVYSQNIVALYIAHCIIKNFEKGDLPMSARNISEQLKLPVRLVRHVLYELIEGRILAETPSKYANEPAFLPAKDIQKLTVFEIIDNIKNKGSEYDFIDVNKEPLSIFHNILKESRMDFSKASYNKPIREI